MRVIIVTGVNAFEMVYILQFFLHYENNNIGDVWTYVTNVIVSVVQV
jgi:hypothetical protein